MRENPLSDLLAKRRDRAIAIILRAKEQECDPYMPTEASSRYRKVVLDQMNAFYEICLDVLNTTNDESVVVNEHYLQKLCEKIDELHEVVVHG